MTDPFYFTALFFPLYMLIRHPFRRIPLHIDCGFYVANHTIATGRFSFRRGWNAHYAGCSKVIPEVFYTLLYLTHCRGNGEPGEKYVSLSRVWMSVFNYVTAISVGMLAMVLAGGDPIYYCAGLVTFALLSSEPHYGAYHECGETFQILADTVGVTLLLLGVAWGSTGYVAVAAAVWLFGAFYIKLSNLVGFSILFGVAAWLLPASIKPMCIAAGIVAASYLAWVLVNRRNPLSLVGRLWGHEKSFNRRGKSGGIGHRLAEKSRTATRAFRNQPIIPILALVGLVGSPPASAIFWAYVAAVVVAYTAQATDCRYYLVPLLPALSVLAALGAVFTLQYGSVGMAILAGAALLWLLHNPVRAALLNPQKLNLWSWKDGHPATDVQRNSQLASACQSFAPLVAGQPLLVYGPCNQAYVLLNAGYSTPIVAPEYYLDSVCPGWQVSHNAQLVKDPPQWILDTGRCFASQEARSMLGLDYRLHQKAGDSRLYKLRTAQQPSANYEEARTFAPQTSSQLEEEAHLGEVRVTFHNAAESAPDPVGSALVARLHALATAGQRRIAIYGAGRFTIRYADIYRQAPLSVVCVIDDNAAGMSPAFLNWPVRAPDDVDPADIDAIIISTDRYADLIAARAARLWGDRIPAYTIDQPVEAAATGS